MLEASHAYAHPGVPYGAHCNGLDDDSTAFGKSIRAVLAGPKPSGSIRIPAGVCVLSAPLVVSVPAGGGIALVGAGADVSVLKFAAGIDAVAITLGTGAGASISGLTILRSGAHRAGNTALAISETGARSGAVSVRDVVTASESYPGSWARGIALTSTDDAAIDHVHTIAGFPPEEAYGLVVQGAAGHYAVDTSISNSKFQGGAAGILMRGYVQGILATNIFAIAGRVGLCWTDGETSAAYVPELLEITNAHFNATEQDLRVHGVSLSLSNSMLWRWPDGLGNASAWTAIELYHADSSVITGNNVNGGNGGRFTGAESFLHMTDSSAVMVSANTVLTINGAAVRIDGASTLDQVAGNVFNGVKTGVIDSSGRINTIVTNSVNGRPQAP